MGAALVGGLISAGTSANDIVVVERDEQRRAQLKAELGVSAISTAPEAEGHVIAVKPNDVEAACKELAAVVPRRVLSVAAGITISLLEGWLPDETAVVRCMPNTPALVGKGMAAVAPGTSATDADLSWAEGILESVGKVVRVRERQLDAVTAVSGSGPAYVFFLAEAMTRAAIDLGIDDEMATVLVEQTVFGAGALLEQSSESAEALRAAVTSPGGTTAAAVSVLESSRVQEAFVAAIRAAAARSAALGK